MIEYFIPMPSGRHGDWLNFWGQYLGTWIALMGSSTIAIVVASLEIRANRVTDMRMFQIKEREHALFQLIDVIQDLMLQFEMPVFREAETNQVKPEYWVAHIKQVDELRTYLGTMAPRISHFRYRLPADFISNLWAVFEDGSEVNKKQDIIFKTSETFKEMTIKFATMPEECLNNYV